MWWWWWCCLSVRTGGGEIGLSLPASSQVHTAAALPTLQVFTTCLCVCVCVCVCVGPVGSPPSSARASCTHTHTHAHWLSSAHESSGRWHTLPKGLGSIENFLLFTIMAPQSHVSLSAAATAHNYAGFSMGRDTRAHTHTHCGAPTFAALYSNVPARIGTACARI